MRAGSNLEKRESIVAHINIKPPPFFCILPFEAVNYVDIKLQSG
jgi:hypothetical protein